MKCYDAERTAEPKGGNAFISFRSDHKHPVTFVKLDIDGTRITAFLFCGECKRNLRMKLELHRNRLQGRSHAARRSEGNMPEMLPVDPFDIREVHPLLPAQGIPEADVEKE